MNRPKTLLLIMIILLIAPAIFAPYILAHECWIAPNRYLFLNNSSGTLTLRVGEDFNGEAQLFRREKIDKLIHYTSANAEDLGAKLVQAESPSAPLILNTEGTHLIAYSSHPSFIELAGDKFNSYLKEEGLENILQLRKQQGTDKDKARELYFRCAKTLIQVGNQPDQSYALIAGQRLEIVPEENPYKLSLGDKLTVKILFDGKPLNNGLIKAWQKQDASSKTQSQTAHTNSAGQATFNIDQDGDWLLCLVHMIPAEDTQKADWQSYWASLTFGVAPKVKH